jgi:hypothetical protein
VGEFSWLTLHFDFGFGFGIACCGSEIATIKAVPDQFRALDNCQFVIFATAGMTIN